MLIEFNIKNFKSFKDLHTLSLVASTDDKLLDSNVFKATFPQAARSKDLNLLKTAAIYGANASGKSNLIQALSFMNWFVQNSTNVLIDQKIQVSPYLLSEETELKPSLFEISFIYNAVRYRYGFEVDTEKVHSEWLFFAPLGKEAKLFTREEQNFEIGEYFKEGNKLQDKTKKNTLFLSVAAQFNGEIATKILTWFQGLNIISGFDDEIYVKYTVNRLSQTEFRDKALKFLKIADLGIDEISIAKKELSKDKISESLQKKLKEQYNISDNQEIKSIGLYEVYGSHKKYDKSHNNTDIVRFLFDSESQGTQKFLSLSGPIIDTLQNGTVLVIDELEARLHPLLTRYIIQLFNSSENNPNNAQLIFATHDNNLLDNRLFRRDQIWFTEKDRYGETKLYSLFDFKIDSKKTRPDATYRKDYILGKYGAIPIIGDPSSII